MSRPASAPGRWLRALWYSAAQCLCFHRRSALKAGTAVTGRRVTKYTRLLRPVDCAGERAWPPPTIPPPIFAADDDRNLRYDAIFHVVAAADAKMAWHSRRAVMAMAGASD